jgi:hypothetical protein
MCGIYALPQPSERFVAGSAVALATILFVSILTIWGHGALERSLLEGGLFAARCRLVRQDVDENCVDPLVAVADWSHSQSVGNLECVREWFWLASAKDSKP